MLDRIKFSRVMELTTSSNENEAMNALRLANKMLKAAGLTWSQMVQSSERVSRKSHDDTPPPPAGQQESRKRYTSPFGPFSDFGLDEDLFDRIRAEFRAKGL